MTPDTTITDYDGPVHTVDPMDGPDAVGPLFVAPFGSLSLPTPSVPQSCSGTLGVVKNEYWIVMDAAEQSNVQLWGYTIDTGATVSHNGTLYQYDDFHRIYSDT